VDRIQGHPYTTHRESFSASVLGAQERHKQRKFTVPVELACLPANCARTSASDGAEETTATNAHRRGHPLLKLHPEQLPRSRR
jgi:hypothetical protein